MKIVQLHHIIDDIIAYPVHAIQPLEEETTFKLILDPRLLQDLSGNTGAYFVRFLFDKLHIDEHRIFRWRLENKFRQYQILNYFFPDAVPESISFCGLMHNDQGRLKIQELVKNGFFIKSTLGHRSGIRKDFDRTAELDLILKSCEDNNGELDQWMLQKKKQFRAEFRVHTFGGDLLNGLSFIMEGENSELSREAEYFVLNLLNKLPDAILQNTLIGWDIGITTKNDFYIIETNLTGFHPEFHRGFQTSGYFGDTDYGPIMCAFLNNYFKSKYRISIDSVGDELLSENEFYREYLFYSSILNQHHLDFFEIKSTMPFVAALLYIGDTINQLVIRLIKYLQTIDYVNAYYVVICKQHINAVNSMVFADNNVHFIQEDLLFKPENYIGIERLPFDERKERCCHKALQKIGEVYCVVF